MNTLYLNKQCKNIGLVYITGSLFHLCFRVFANSICNKLADILEGLATPVEMKMKLIPILQNMHHDPTSTAKVRADTIQHD